MKANIIKLLLTIVLGISSVFYLNNKNILDNTIYILQIGAFKSINNANILCNEYSSCIVIKEDNLYKSIIGIYSNKDLVNKRKDQLNNTNIYIKNINNNDLRNKINKYEKKLLKTDNLKEFNNINNIILNTYLEENKNE